MTTVTNRPAASPHPIQAQVDRLLRIGHRPRSRQERQAAREIGYGDYLKVLLEDIRQTSYSK